jgi:2'-5' RNA ligase
VRLFVAFPIPEPVRREVRRRSAGLRHRLPRARWVDPEMLHLNLLFVGAVEPQSVAPLTDAVAEVSGRFAPIPLRLSDAGGFPPNRPARVAWVGVEAPPDLSSLQGELAVAAHQAVGLEIEERPYRPHVTLARCPAPWQRRTLDQLAAAFAGEIGPPFVADAASLFESTLSPRGPRYRQVATFALSGATAAAGVAG